MKNAARLLACFLLGVLICSYVNSCRSAAAILSAPDGVHTVTIYSPMLLPVPIDNNYQVVVADAVTGEERLSFLTPDESWPTDSLRAIWTDDSKHILVVGRNVSTEPEVKLANGDIVYLEIDVESRTLSCNASQSRLPRVDISPAKLQAYGLLLAEPE